MKTKIFLPFTLGLFLIFFSCKKDQSELTVKDIDGNIYKTIKIGDQIWMAENLKTHKLNDGTPIPYVTADATWADVNITEPMMCYYDNDERNKDKYGALYNWYAVNSGKLAPVGWHVAKNADWQVLFKYLLDNGYNYDGSTVDNKVAKSLAATEGWIDDPTPGNTGNQQVKNNKSGFTALPAGARVANGNYVELKHNAFWWVHNQQDAGLAKYYTVSFNDPDLFMNYFQIGSGFSVRCVKD